MDGFGDGRDLCGELALELLLEGRCSCHIAILALGTFGPLELFLKTCVKIGGVRFNAKKSCDLGLDLIVCGCLPLLLRETKDNRFLDKLIGNGSQRELRLLANLAGCATNLLNELAQPFGVVPDRVLCVLNLNSGGARAVSVVDPLLADSKPDEDQSSEDEGNNTGGGIELRTAAEQLAADSAMLPLPGGCGYARPATAFRHGD